MKSGKIYSFHNIILAMGITLLGFVLFNWFQQPIQHSLNLLFDANQYEKAYDYFRGEALDYEINYPFSVRIFVTWLAAQLPSDAVFTNFKAINLFFGLIWIPLWFKLSENMGLDRFKAWLGWFWITFHWVGVLKANLSDPITVDVPIYFFQLLILYAIISKNWILLLVATPFATIQKESIFPILLTLSLFPGLDFWKRGDKKACLSLIGATLISWLTLTITTHFFPATNVGKNGVVNLFYNTLGLLAHPDLLIRWVLSLSLAYGAFVWILVWNWKKLVNFKNSHHKVLVPLIAIYTFFSLIAGGDFTRIAFLGAPYFFLLLLPNLHLSKTQWIVLLSISVPAMRLFEFIPDGGSDFNQWKTWYPEYAPWQWALIYSAYTLVLMAVSKKWLIAKPQVA